MKKFLSVMLAVVMVLGCVIALSSCDSWSSPEAETNFSTAEMNLTNNNYYVVIEYAYEDELGIGISQILKAYDLTPFIRQKTIEAEERGEYFDFQQWKYEMGYTYEDIMEAWAMGRSADLTMTMYYDEEFATIAYDRLKLENDYANDRKTALDKDAKEHSESYNSSKVDAKYEEKYEEWYYKRCKYILDHYSYELSDSERLQYQSVVDDYENGDDEYVFGRNGYVVWTGTEAAVKATTGNN